MLTLGFRVVHQRLAPEVLAGGIAACMMSAGPGASSSMSKSIAGGRLFVGAGTGADGSFEAACAGKVIPHIVEVLFGCLAAAHGADMCIHGRLLMSTLLLET